MTKIQVRTGNPKICFKNAKIHCLKKSCMQLFTATKYIRFLPRNTDLTGERCAKLAGPEVSLQPTCHMFLDRASDCRDSVRVRLCFFRLSSISDGETIMDWMVFLCLFDVAKNEARHDISKSRSGHGPISPATDFL